MKKGYTLKSPFDFDNAKFFGVRVEVWQHGQIIDYGGKIDNHSDIAIMINGVKYLKDTCEFRVK